MKFPAFAIGLASVLFVGCAGNPKSVAPASTDPLRTSIGQRVTLIGVAEPQKTGAALRGEDFYVWIDGLHDWPSGYLGHRVEVVGLLEERHDLPVFVQEPNEPAIAGIPVPPGADLQAASRRLVIRDARWRLLR